MQEGKIIQVDHLRGDFFLIIHKAGFSYFLTGDAGLSITDSYGVITGDGLPQYFHLYDPPSRLIEMCLMENNIINTKLRSRLQLRYMHNSLIQSIEIPKGFYVKQISEADIASLKIFNLLLEKKFWSSISDFLTNGFGYCVYTHDGKPASICYSVCISNGLAEIDVATLPQFQQMGLAKIAVSEFVHHCLRHNIVANWDCFKENTASLSTASRIGFEQVFEYPFLSIFNKIKSA